MNQMTIRFQCGKCQARIKAPAQLIGQTRTCPGCGQAFVVRPDEPKDEGPRLVLWENDDRLSLGVA